MSVGVILRSQIEIQQQQKQLDYDSVSSVASGSSTSTSITYTSTSYQTSSASAAHRSRNRSASFSGGSASGSEYKQRQSSAAQDSAFIIQNAMALAVIERLHRWCCQLFYLTIIYIVNWTATNGDKDSPSCNASTAANGACSSATQNEKRVPIFNEVRRSLINASAGNVGNGSQRRLKTVSDLEMQLLRHLTTPQKAFMPPLKPATTSRHSRRHYFLSRPPSPQLFKISEEEGSEDTE